MFALCRPKHHGSTPRGTPRNFRPKWPTPWFERRRNSIANCGRMVTDSATVTMENHHRSVEWCHSWPPTTSPSQKCGFHMPAKYANGQISVTGDPIHFMFGYRLGFSGSADRMALFPPIFRLHQIHVGGRLPSWIISNGYISATAHSIHLYSAHRAVIFAIAQLSCQH